MSKSLFGSVEQQFTDSVSRFVRGFGYDNRSAYDGYDHYGATGIDGRPDTRQVYSQNWDTGLRYNGVFSSHSWWQGMAVAKIRTMIRKRPLR